LPYLDEVAERLGRARRRGEHVLDAGELEHLLGHARGDDTGHLGAGTMRTVTEPHLPVTL
jgi:hypothetical protein